MKKLGIVLLALSSLWTVEAQAAMYILQKNGKCDERSTGTYINFEKTNYDWPNFTTTIATILNIGNAGIEGFCYKDTKVTENNWAQYVHEILSNETDKICVLTSSDRVCVKTSSSSENQVKPAYSVSQKASEPQDRQAQDA